MQLASYGVVMQHSTLTHQEPQTEHNLDHTRTSQAHALLQLLLLRLSVQLIVLEPAT